MGGEVGVLGGLSNQGHGVFGRALGKRSLAAQNLVAACWCYMQPCQCKTTYSAGGVEQGTALQEDAD